MYREKTLFVVGAGASHEVGLSLGTGLVSKIASALAYKQTINGFTGGDDAIRRTLMNFAGQGKAGALLLKASAMAQRLPYADSIDSFLNDFKDETDLATTGKIAIAHIISTEERRSAISVNRDNIYNGMNSSEQLNASWLPKFFGLLKSDIGASNIDALFDNVSIVCFNYDRCIEQYLYYAIRSYYNFSPQQAITLLRRLKIVRPYGSIGAFALDLDLHHTNFGFNFSDAGLIETSKVIRTVYERQGESSEDVRDLVDAANQIVFLGFGFLPLNLKMLRPSVSRASNMPAVYATAFGMPNQARQELIGRIVKTLILGSSPSSTQTDRIELQLQMKCRELLDSYAILLTK
jgi:hypothetical protein